MARLSEQEKKQLRSATRRASPRAPKVPLRPVRDFVEFATFASTLNPAPKPVRFGGQHWKL